ncbi:MAG: hypothetical protein LBC74_15740 [Planctomycetaceae bacterium]|jgi:hypothetical protein|nr:hypothetical protein [Planctomycetaceae bacterium]
MIETTDVITYKNFITETLSYIEKGTPSKPWLQGRLHAGLADEYYGLGMYYIPVGSISYAKGAFQNAVNIRYWLFKKYFSIHDWTRKEIENLKEQYEERVLLSPNRLSAAAWKELLLAVLLNYPEIDDFNQKYAIIARRKWPMYEHAAESQYIGLLISYIIDEATDSAMKLLEKKKPSIEAMFRGLPECLENIVRKNKEGFFESIKNAAKQWKKVARGSEKIMPYSTCFIWGCCLFKLSERVFGKNIYHDFLEQNEKLNFPQQLFDTNICPKDPYPIPDFVFNLILNMDGKNLTHE